MGVQKASGDKFCGQRFGLLENRTHGLARQVRWVAVPLEYLLDGQPQLGPDILTLPPVHTGIVADSPNQL